MGDRYLIKAAELIHDEFVDETGDIKEAICLADKRMYERKQNFRRYTE